MEREEKRVEVDEINLGFCLLHIFFKVSPCGYAKVMGAYKVKKKDEKIQKMTILGVELAITYSNFFIYYEQDMEKSIIFLDYYNNVYQGLYENW
jgi:signal peptidase I